MYIFCGVFGSAFAADGETVAGSGFLGRVGFEGGWIDKTVSSLQFGHSIIWPVISSGNSIGWLQFRHSHLAIIFVTTKSKWPENRSKMMDFFDLA